MLLNRDDDDISIFISLVCDHISLSSTMCTTQVRRAFKYLANVGIFSYQIIVAQWCVGAHEQGL